MMHVDGSRTIHVIGDVMLDRYVRGRVARVSPEATAPLYVRESQEGRLGGAANVAANVVSMGGKAHLVGLVGEAYDDLALAKLAEKVGQPDRWGYDLLMHPGRQVTVKTRFLDSHGRQVFRIDRDAVPTGTEMDEILSLLLRRPFKTGQGGCLVLSDYGKGALPFSLVPTLIGKARGAGMQVLVDTKSASLCGVLSGATLVKPNLETAGRMYVAITNNAPMPLGWPHMQEAVDSVGKLLAEHMSCSVLITQGECGMTLYDPMRGPPESLPGMVCPVADAIGAGDSVLACLAVNLAGGASMREAVLASNVAGCLAVRAAGVQQVQLGALVDEIFRFKGPDSKIVDFARAGVVSKIWRDLGHSVVFTNGCFDMLHYGHMHLLREAKKQGHRLVVGLNSDASVSRLKGKNRPKVSSLERARALADLPYVDLVVVFAEDTPESLVRVVKPLVLVKGADYYGKKVAGESEVVGNGGRLVLIPSLQGISTTEILGSDEFMKT